MAEVSVELVVDHVSKSFGGLQAVRDCSVRVEAGSITGLIGPNGAGKSTLFNIVAGAVQPDAGSVRFGGEELVGLSAAERFKRGLLRTFQIAKPFHSMSALENLMAAPGPQRGEGLLSAWLEPGRVARDEEALRARARETLEFLGLDHVRHERAGLLSGGQKKLLELGRTIMADARFVLLDEVAAGVNRTLLNSLADRIEELNKERGVTFFLIEHDIGFVSRLCQPVVVMAQGAVLKIGAPADVRRDPEVVEAYFGGAAPEETSA
ncbi:MAG: ABC transporter ATP-binding protein [Neomegalonema sp.]|nr:ABC transporter ATP-binding protein [Neomegalonema sp.]